MSPRAAAALLVVGDSAPLRLLEQLARELELPTVRGGSGGRLPVVAVAGGRAEDVAAAIAARPDALFVEPDAAPELGPEWFGASGAWTLLLAAWSPLVARAGREVLDLGPLQHLDARVRLPGGGGLATACGLAAWHLPSVDEVVATGPATAQLRAGSPAVVALVDAEPSTGATEWSLEAAGPDDVVRLELAPHVALERRGTALALPDSGDAAAQAASHLGLTAFLRDLRDGTLLDPTRRPTAAHPAWGLEVARLLVAHARSHREGTPVAPDRR